ncbi:UbiH/UbiF family hydroxylase [Oricola sp.]|uniref:UbiH/UbiF family hydroxylase n=1 Tax=Oricola sp. TaxID=1979950 RepID=UPI003BA8688A
MVETEIAVIGAGPAAMTAALEAASHGYETTLVAPTGTFVDGDDRTTALMMPAIAMLEAHGAWPQIVESAAPLKSMRIIDGTKRLVRAPTVTFEAAEIDEEAFGYNIPNRVLNEALANRLENAPKIRRVDAMARSATFSRDHASISLDNDDTVNANLVIAADGVDSVMRKAAGIDVRRWSYPQTAVVLSFSHTHGHGDTSTEIHTETGPFTVVPMPGRRSSLVWVVTPQQAEKIIDTPPEELAASIEEGMGSMLGRVFDITKPQRWPLSGLIAHRFGANRLMLAGQTAHVFPPIGAQGLNLGMRDIADLGKCVAAAPSDPGAPGVTARYDRLRRADVMSRTGAVDLLNRSLLTGFLPVQFARAAGLGLISAVPPVRGLFMREGMQPGWGFRALAGLGEKFTETGRAEQARS